MISSLRRPIGAEPIVWGVFALLAALLIQPMGNLPRISNDSCEYLSAAENIRTAHRMETSLVHYDTERSHGVIPSPLTWFPPGYPIAIALTSAITGGFESAALWVSLISFAFITCGVWLLARLLDLSVWAARIAVFCWIANSYALGSSGAALSESLFTLFGLATLLFLLLTQDSPDNATARLCWIGAALTAGFSYWIRYAGILWIAAFLAILLLQTVLSKKRTLSPALILVSVVTAILPAIPLAIRNLKLVGDWKGGNNLVYAMPLREFATETPKLWYHLIVGHAAASRIWFPVVLMALGLSGLVVGAVVKGKRSPSDGKRLLPGAGICGLLLVCLIYSAGIAEIALHSVISYIPRMYVPVLPHLIVLALLGVSHLVRRMQAGGTGRVLAGCLLAGYFAANFLAYSEFRAPDMFQQTREALMAPDETGRSLETHLSEELLARGEVIAATDGQIVGHILRHPTLSLASRPFTTITWDERSLRAEMTSFGALHLLVSREDDLDPVVPDSPFLAALAGGRSVPWLRLVARNREFSVYRRQ